MQDVHVTPLVVLLAVLPGDPVFLAVVIVLRLGLPPLNQAEGLWYDYHLLMHSLPEEQCQKLLQFES